MSVINKKIPPQNFEKTLDAIGSILLVELEAQKGLDSDITEEISIYKDRITPIGQGEELVLNLQLSGASYSNQNRKSVSGEVTYHIDFYINSGSTENEYGENISTKRLNKFIGLVRYILSHSEYRTLGFKPGTISNSEVQSFQILENALKEDSNFVKFGRLVFIARMIEEQDIEIGVSLHQNLTNVKLNLTNLGYKYEFNN